MISMNIIKHFLKAIIILLIITSVLIAAFELSSGDGQSRPFLVKKECLEGMKKIQGASYFYLMERPKFTGEVSVNELIKYGYMEQMPACKFLISSRSDNYKVFYKRDKNEINFIDVACENHGHLSRQGDCDREKGLPNGFVDNYMARVKTRFDLYK